MCTRSGGPSFTLHDEAPMERARPVRDAEGLHVCGACVCVHVCMCVLGVCMRMHVWGVCCGGCCVCVCMLSGAI